MSTLYKNLLGFVLLVGLSSCTSSITKTLQAQSGEGENRPLVVATTSVLCDLTQQIAQDTVNLKCLVGAGVDPHIYQPTPQDRQAIDSARLILYGGYNFDPSLIKLVKASSNPAPKIAVHEQAVPKPLMGEEQEDEHGHEEEEHQQEETEGEVPDPHVWHDASNGIAMVKTIATALENLQPQEAQKYQQKSAQLTEEITKIDSWIKTEIATIAPNKRKLITTHDALIYYANAYGLAFEGALSGLSTDEAPTAARVGELVKDIKKAQVPTIFAETSINPKLIATVAKEANVRVSERRLYADGLGEKGSEGDSYQKMLMANTRAIVEGLGF